MTFAANLKRIRKSRCIRLVDLAALAGYSVSYFSQVENNEANPSGNFITSVAKALNVSPAELWGGVVLTPDEMSVIEEYRNRKLTE